MKYKIKYGLLSCFLMLNSTLYCAASSSSDTSPTEKFPALIPSLMMLAAKAVGENQFLTLNEDGTVTPKTVNDLIDTVYTITDNRQQTRALIYANLDLVPYKVHTGKSGIPITANRSFFEYADVARTLKRCVYEQKHWCALSPDANKVIYLADSKAISIQTCGVEDICTVGINEERGDTHFEINVDGTLALMNNNKIISLENGEIFQPTADKKLYGFIESVTPTLHSEYMREQLLNMACDGTILRPGRRSARDKPLNEEEIADEYRNICMFILIKKALKNVRYAHAADSNTLLDSLVAHGSTYLPTQTDLAAWLSFEAYAAPLLQSLMKPGILSLNGTGYHPTKLHKTKSREAANDFHPTKYKENYFLYFLLSQGNIYYENYDYHGCGYCTDEAFQKKYFDNAPQVNIEHIRKVDFNAYITFIEQVLTQQGTGAIPLTGSTEAQDLYTACHTNELFKAMFLLYMIAEAHGDNEACLNRLSETLRIIKRTDWYSGYLSWARANHNPWQLYRDQYQHYVPTSHLENIILRKKAIITSKRSGQGPLLSLLDKTILFGPKEHMLDEIHAEFTRPDFPYALQDIALCLANRTCFGTVKHWRVEENCLSTSLFRRDEWPFWKPAPPLAEYNIAEYNIAKSIASNQHCIHAFVKDYLTVKRQSMTREELDQLPNIDIALLTTVVAHLPDPNNPADTLFLAYEQERSNLIKTQALKATVTNAFSPIDIPKTVRTALLTLAYGWLSKQTGQN